MLISFNSFACECETRIVNGKTENELFIEDSFENATLIFYGNYIGDGKFESIKFYKGKKLLDNRKLIAEKDAAYICDFFFEKNKRYLVFGEIDENGKLWTSICYANTQIDNKKQLKFIKKHLKK